MEVKSAIETKQRIKEAFLKLYEVKRIEKISIKEITDKAGVNRGTFYSHYLDIYDLLEKIENEAIEEVKFNLLPVVRAMVKEKKLDLSLMPIAFLNSRRDILMLFFGEGVNFRLVERLKDLMKKVVTEILEVDIAKDSMENIRIKYVLEYVSSAQVAILSHWFRNNGELPIEELGKLMEEINLKGAITYLTRITDQRNL